MNMGELETGSTAPPSTLLTLSVKNIDGYNQQKVRKRENKE